MPNLILQIDSTDALEKYIDSTNNIIIVYYYSSNLEDKFNHINNIKNIFSEHLPEDTYCSFIKCCMSKQLSTIKSNHSFFLKFGNKEMIYEGPAMKLKNIVKLLLH